jgi:hypothetical protein
MCVSDLSPNQQMKRHCSPQKYYRDALAWPQEARTLVKSRAGDSNSSRFFQATVICELMVGKCQT